MFKNSTLFGTSFPLVKTAPKVRGCENDIGKLYNSTIFNLLMNTLS